MLKQALKSKTVQYGIAITCLFILQGFVGFIPANLAIQVIIGCGIALGIVVLRFITTQPLSEK